MAAVELRMQITSIAEARRLLKGVGDDTEVLKRKMKEFGIPARDAKLLVQALNKELNASRKEALGLVKETKPLAAHIRDGVLQANLLEKAMANVGKTIQSLAGLGKVKTIEEMTEDAIKLEKQLVDTRDAMNMTGPEFQQYYQTLKAASIKSNIPIPTLDKAVNQLQAKDTELAKKLIFDKQGEGIIALAEATAASKSKDPEQGIFARGLLQKDLPGMNTARAMEIIRAGEQKGAATAEDITTLMGGSIARTASLRGLNVYDPAQSEQALREGQAMAQLFASGRGITSSAEASTIFENYAGHIGRSEVRKKFKKNLGVDTLDAKGNVRSYPDLIDEIYARQKAGKLKPTALADAATDEQFKRSIEIGLQSATPTKTPGQVVRELTQVDPRTGRALMDTAFQGIFGTTEGRLDANARQAEFRTYEELPSKSGLIVDAARKISRVNSQMPGTAKAVDAATDFLPPKAAAVAKGTLIGVIASSDQESALGERERLMRERNEMVAGQRRNEGKDNIVVNTVVNVQEGIQAKVTSEATTSKDRAKGKGQPAKLPGRS